MNTCEERRRHKCMNLATSSRYLKKVKTLEFTKESGPSVHWVSLKKRSECAFQNLRNKWKGYQRPAKARLSSDTLELKIIGSHWSGRVIGEKQQ